MPDANAAEPTGQPPPPMTGSANKPEAKEVAPPAQSQGGKSTATPSTGKRRWWVWAGGGVLAVLVLIEGIPWIITAFRTVSTDDAYVNGHVTFVAPRVAGQVTRVLVDDNNRVSKGDLLVQLDKEPYQVQVDIAQTAVSVAQADLVATQAKVRGMEGLARSQRFALARAVEDLDNQVAELRGRVATLQSKRATLARARADYDRDRGLVKQGAVSKQEFDAAAEAQSVAEAEVGKAQEDVYQIRANLGIPPNPQNGEDLAAVPANLDESYSAVREAQFRLMQTAAQLGVVQSFDVSPRQMLERFYKRDAQGDIDRILAQLLKDAPPVKQAEAKVDEAQAHLDQAKLDLRYCDVVAEIDGVVTRRNVNPGDHVIAGQSMMAVRSLTEVWVDANFKETQLSKLRIGQPVDLDVDMYGSRQHFRGRISGFTMGTGSTLALLPAENATGNFVKVVQRLPVRIELLDYNPDTTPLFVGLSVTPYVHVNQKPTGPDAGKVLQPHSAGSAAVPAETR
jgi:membrane fusion protein (multidrug efflux system)